MIRKYTEKEIKGKRQEIFKKAYTYKTVITKYIENKIKSKNTQRILQKTNVK